MAAFSMVIFITFISLVLFIIGIIILAKSFTKIKTDGKKKIIKGVIGIALLLPIIYITIVFISGTFKMNNARDLEKGSMILAIQNNNMKTIESIVNSGANVNEIRRFVIGSYYEYHTPLSYACLLNNYDIAKYLINKGSDVNKNIIWDNKNGFESLTPAMIACQNNNIQLLKLLVQTGANINKKTNRDSLFLIALKKGELALIEYLDNKNVDKKFTDLEFSEPPIFTVASYNPKVDILKYVFDTNIDRDINYTASDGLSVFMVSVKNNNSYDFNMYLIELGARIDGVDIFGNNALIFALKNHDLKMIAYLTKRGLKNIRTSK